MVSKPDWARVGVVPPDHHLSALGDATRWGATIPQHFPGAANLAESPGLRIVTDQVLSVSCRDAYPRAWSIMGTVSAPTDLWALPDGLGLGEFGVAFVVTAGLGQATITHVINIRAVIDADAPFYYPSDFAGLPPGQGSFFPEARTRPFTIPNAVFGNKVNARLITSYFFPAGPVPFAAADVVTTLLLSPYSPGVEAPG